jgi:hypothetical protein
MPFRRVHRVGIFTGSQRSESTDYSLSPILCSVSNENVGTFVPTHIGFELELEIKLEMEIEIDNQGSVIDNRE